MNKNMLYKSAAIILSTLLIAGCSNDEKKETTKETMKETTKKQTDSNEKKKQKKEEKKIEKREPVKVKGLYMSAWTMSGGRMEHFIDLLNTTELNALVIDAKEDDGYITYGETKVKSAIEIGADKETFMKNFDGRMKKLKENNVYTIARVVTFRDPLLANSKPELAMQRKDGGGVWRDYAGMSWVDPYKKEVWEHVVNIAKEAAERGFDEIQFDYVRFPENGAKVDREVSFDNPNNWGKEKVISEFLQYAKKELEPYGVYVSADIFGLVTSNTDDMGIGQKWESIAPYLDYISPMTYPSHYGAGNYGFSVPDANPYGVLKQAMTDAVKRNEALAAEGKKPAIIRPWLQDFTATWVPGHAVYDAHEVREQIRALDELGVEEYMMWNPANTYSENAWEKQ